MTTPSPIEQLHSEIDALQTRIGWMQDSARLKTALDAIEDRFGAPEATAAEDDVFGRRRRGR